ncbi:Major facilitator superfamily domain, general substrate transporter [Cynara cardunculus var. scolymus]|uniref:Major facilitator superfamily domain, general substrate transporter n=1 Tax=Cynara cardunculus var. scolymus TaxID=59895 RepID=A0A103XES5_CYNCS|nr:Major facilitator superfamily domain, general substrate transporter [Cynara cardunculus var. scolymus]
MKVVNICRFVYVAATFAFENMANLALAVNLVTYFNTVMHYDIADAANHLTDFMGTGYILSIVMACLADAYIGRFRTVLIAAFIEFVVSLTSIYINAFKHFDFVDDHGLALLTLQAHYPKLKPPLCNIFLPTSNCEKVNGGNAVLLFLAIYLLAVGGAGVKAALPSHGADQFDEKYPKEATQMSTYFNWLLLGVAVGGSVSLTCFVWVQDNKGWDWGFGLSTIAMFLGALIFVFGLPQWLDKAAIVSDDSESPSPWKLCRVTQVENAKILLAMVPVFLCSIIMTLCLAQLQTWSVQQGVTMDIKLTKSFNMPPASLPIIPVAFLVIMIPIYDQIFVPLMRKLTGIPTGIRYLQRVGVGLILSSLSMAIAGVMEVKRKNVAKDHDMLDAIPLLQPLPISVFWLSFQYFIFGIADMFTYVGLLEFFYSQAPKPIKSISSCFLWSSMAIGYFMSSIMVKIVNHATKGATKSGGWLAGNNINRNHLEFFYWMLAILSLINFAVYLLVAMRYKYRPQSLDVEHEYEEHQLKTLKPSSTMEDL